ncbi:MAG: hypothetical protein IJ635_04585 [Bacteroidaceae bacterium]|nr:hypothetical protein [Bacteroidaceae bacterium]
MLDMLKCKWMLWLLLMMGSTTAFALNHKRVFGDDWLKAELYVKEHRVEWRETFDYFGVDASVAEAVVFPELVRYSMWQDEIEKAAVSSLYVAGGKLQANFSIGRFQMKPSFAEEVDAEWNRSALAREFGFVFDTHDTDTARRNRLRRLNDTVGQVRYLAIFIRLQHFRHPELSRLTKKEQVRYLSTAYNRSYMASWKEILHMEQERHFHTDIIKTRYTRLFCYGDIAVEFYERAKK